MVIRKSLFHYSTLLLLLELYKKKLIQEKEQLKEVLSLIHIAVAGALRGTLGVVAQDDRGRCELGGGGRGGCRRARERDAGRERSGRGRLCGGTPRQIRRAAGRRRRRTADGLRAECVEAEAHASSAFVNSRAM